MSEFGVDARAAHDPRGRAGRGPPSSGAAAEDAVRAAPID
jgi:hypothetical protein